MACQVKLHFSRLFLCASHFQIDFQNTFFYSQKHYFVQVSEDLKRYTHTKIFPNDACAYAQKILTKCKFFLYTLYNLLNTLTTKCEMFQCAAYVATLAPTGVLQSNKIRASRSTTSSNIHFHYSYPLNYVSDRTVTRNDNWGGGAYHIFVLLDGFLWYAYAFSKTSLSAERNI